MFRVWTDGCEEHACARGQGGDRVRVLRVGFDEGPSVRRDRQLRPNRPESGPRPAREPDSHTRRCMLRDVDGDQSANETRRSVENEVMFPR